MGCGLNFRPALGMQFVTLQECNLSHFRNASKGVVCAQTSVPFRNVVLKVPVYKKCVHVRKFVVPVAVAALAVSLSKNCDENKEERARRLTRKLKRRQRDKR